MGQDPGPGIPSMPPVRSPVTVAPTFPQCCRHVHRWLWSRQSPRRRWYVHQYRCPHSASGSLLQASSRLNYPSEGFGPATSEVTSVLLHLSQRHVKTTLQQYAVARIKKTARSPPLCLHREWRLRHSPTVVAGSSTDCRCTGTKGKTSVVPHKEKSNEEAPPSPSPLDLRRGQGPLQRTTRA